jgi:hypothetical protein
MKIKYIFKNFLDFLLIGTTPIRLIEGIILNILVLSFSLSFFIFGYSFILILLSTTCLVAFKHLRTCRILYEVRIDELEAFQSKSLKFHKSVDLIIKIFEYYLIGFSIFLILYFTSLLLGFTDLPSFLIILTPFLYAFITIFGHFSRVRAIKEVSIINRNLSI